MERTGVIKKKKSTHLDLVDFRTSLFFFCGKFDPHLHSMTVILVHPVIRGQTLALEVRKDPVVW